jgi:hypothetical protein
VVDPSSILMVSRVSLVFRILIATVMARIVTIVDRACVGLITVTHVRRSALWHRWTAVLILVWVPTLIASFHHVVAVWLIVAVILTPLLVAAVPRLLRVSRWPVTVNTTRWVVAVVLAVFIISWPLIIKILISTVVLHRTTPLIVVAISFVSFVRPGIPLAGWTAVWRATLVWTLVSLLILLLMATSHHLSSASVVIAGAVIMTRLILVVIAAWASTPTVIVVLTIVPALGSAILVTATTSSVVALVLIVVVAALLRLVVIMVAPACWHVD